MNTRQRMELFDHLDRLFVGELQPHESQQLARQLAEDPEARDYYAQLVRLDVGLAWSFGTQPQMTLAANPAASQLPASAPVSVPISGPVDRTGNRVPVLGFLARATAAVNRPVVWTILAVGVLFTGYFAVISWNMLGKQLASDSKSEIRNPKSEIDTVATIRETSKVEWSPKLESPLALDGRGAGGKGAAIAKNSPLSITSGLVELQLKQGTTLLIEGPADWKINGDNSATLNRGKLVAKVPKQAVGFTLETPTAKIIDLGTEFGAEVSGSGDVQVSVFRGVVETQSRQGNKQPLQLRAGQSAKIAAGKFHVESIPFTESSFAELRAHGSNSPALNDLVVLFADNFDSSETVADISPSAASRQLRQSGVLRGLSYIERRLDKRPNTPLDDRTSLIAGEPSGRMRMLAKRKSTVTVSPNANFRAEHRSGTRFVVECDVRPVDFTDGGEHPTSDSWAGVIVGCPSQMSLVGESGGISLLIRRDGRYSVFDGTGGKVAVAASSALPPESVPANHTFQVRMEYELARFGGPRPVEVRIDINDVKVAQFTSQRSLLENFIVLQSYTADLPISSDFDNLSISKQELPVRESVNSKQNVD